MESIVGFVKEVGLVEISRLFAHPACSLLFLPLQSSRTIYGRIVSLSIHIQIHITD